MDIDVNQCQPTNYCPDIDDYRPIQSTLLTRFAITTDSSELWRTTNQDYGAFYYRTLPHECIPDNLKAKIHRRHNRFQDWLSYQGKCQNVTPTSPTNNNRQTIFPPSRNQTVRITHRKRFVSECNDQQINRNTFSPCGEDGLITEYIVKKILQKLQCLINPGECHDVVECAQLLVSEILSREPCLCAEEIIDRVITIMITPPQSTERSIPSPCHSRVSVSCPSPQPLHDNCQIIQQPNTNNNNELPLSTTVSVSDPFVKCNQSLPASNVFDKLTDLENAISKISNHFTQA